MSLLSPLIPSSSSDIVAIYLAAGNIPGLDLPDIFNEINLIQAFAAARPVNVQVSEPVDYAVHPLANGSVTTDHRIVRPVEISISFIMRSEDYQITYLLMRQAKNQSVQFTIQTKTDNYTNMYISDMPHEETPEFFDTITIIVRFREIQFFNTGLQDLTEDDVLNPADASTIDRGEQLPTSSSGAQESSGSTLFRLFGGAL